jgi:hypothetical protein
MNRRSTTNRPSTVEDTRRVPVIDYAPTRVFRQPRPPVVVVVDPDARPRSTRPFVPGELAHPRLVRRTRAPSLRPASRDFEDEPTSRL